MRIELSRYRWMGAVWSFIGAMVITICLMFTLLIALASSHLVYVAILGVFIIFSASIAVYAAAVPWLRKGSNLPPLIIIDDAGLWSWRDGPMPWSEIQTIEWREEWGRASADIIVVWRHQHYSVRHWHGYWTGGEVFTDRNGQHWRYRPIYDELKACWERNRRPSCIPSDSD